MPQKDKKLIKIDNEPTKIIAILCIKNQITAEIDYEDIIKTFADQKSRRKILL